MLPWLVLLLVLIVAAAAAFYYYRVYWDVPRLDHTLLPPYEIPDVILVGGLVVENRGRQPAPNVKITVRFDDHAAIMIHHLQVASAENAVLRSGGEQHNFATISARSLRPRGKIFIYWAAARGVQPQISVTSYQPSQENFLSRLLPRKIYT